MSTPSSPVRRPDLPRTAETVVVGRILSLAGAHGLGEVEALAIGAGRVIGAGSRAEIDALRGPSTRRIELEPGEVVLPGLSDSHLHLADASLAVNEVELSAATTPTAGLTLIAAAHETLPPSAWLTGHGWASDRWGGWPTAEALDRAAPGRRIALWAHDHHALWVSRAALDAAGLGSASADPPGGAIRRLDDGRPSGVLHESASGLVTSLIPLPTAEMYEAVLPAIARELVSLGVVAVHDPGVLGRDPSLNGALLAYGRLADAGRLPLRVYASIRMEALDAALERGLRSGMALGSDIAGRARFGWLKQFADGSLGSRTAALLEPFEPTSDAPGAAPDRGIWVTQPEELAARAIRAASGRIATQIHEIGDAAVRAALDAFEAPATRSLPLRARIEHAQLVDPADLARFGRLGIVASIQPVHLRTDARQARASWGDRAERSSYAWRSLLVNGATLAFGTDAPVEPIDPWPGLALAITRRWPSWADEPGPFGPAQALTLAETLRGACLGPAQAEGSDDRGRLVAGQRADLVVIDGAALAEPIEPGGPLAGSRPRLVMIDGVVAHEA